MKLWCVFNLASADLLRCYPHNGQNIIEASFHAYVSADQVSRLFDIVPGLDCCNYDAATGLSRCISLVEARVPFAV